MQYELKTQVIEPRRKTFTHLVKRYGDRPASRYEEGTIDIQPKENFHYRPTWAPDKELYDPAYSAFTLTDPYSFTDPRQYYYTPYVTARSGLHEAFGKTLDYLDQRGLLTKLPEGWKKVVTEVFLPLRHYESGGQLIYSGAARFGYGTTITQCCAYAAFDRVGLAQLISRVGIAVGDGTADLLGDAKTTWTDAEHMQGLRRYVEEVMVEPDWADTVIALDITDHLLYGLLYRELDTAALMDGAGAYSLVSQHLSGWFTDHRKWLDALYSTWLADTTTGPANKEAFQRVLDARLDQAAAAVRDIAAHIDTLAPEAGALTSLDAVLDATHEAYSSLGLDPKKVTS